MSGRRACLLGLLLLFCLTGAVQAGETRPEELYQRQAECLETDKLEDAAQPWLPEADLAAVQAPEGLLSQLFTRARSSGWSIVRETLGSGILLLIITLCCALAESMGLGAKLKVPIIPVAAALAITGVAVGDLRALVGMGRETIENLELFSKALLPTAAGAAALCGNLTGAAARQMATLLFSDFLITLISRLLLPLTFAYIAAVTAWSAVGNGGLLRLAGFLKWLVTTLLTMTLLAFTGYLSITGIMAGSADAATVKAAKFTVSSLVPVVGSVLSDAAESLLVGAAALKNAVGVFGMLVVLAICLLPFLRLGAHYLVYKLTAALSATVSDSRVSGLIDAVGSAFGLILGMTGACAALLLISLVATMRVMMG